MTFRHLVLTIEFYHQRLLYLAQMASHTKQAKTKLSSRSTFGLVGGDVIDSYEEDDSLDFKHSSTDFSHLPAEIMENIFCQLPIVDLMLNCALVCHQWYNVISQDSVSAVKHKFLLVFK